MSDRRRFLHVIGASFVSAGAGLAGLGCNGDNGGEPGDGGLGGASGQGGSSGNQGGAAGQGGSSGNQGGASGGSGGSGEAGQGGAGGEAGQGGAGGSGEAGQGGAGGGGGTPPGTPVGPPSDFTAAKGLHKVSGKKLLIGYDDGGLYALTAICTHQSCDMSGKDGKIMGSGAVQCTCHGSVFTPDGTAVVGPASGTLKAYAIALGDDGILYVDTKTKVANTDRLAL